jgi:hypothetical protein
MYGKIRYGGFLTHELSALDMIGSGMVREVDLVKNHYGHSPTWYIVVVCKWRGDKISCVTTKSQAVGGGSTSSGSGGSTGCGGCSYQSLVSGKGSRDDV